MEPLNKVQLRGTVTGLRIRQVNNSEVANFMVNVTESFRTRSGEAVTRTQFFHVTAWKSDYNDIDRLANGQTVDVQGRLQHRPRLDRDGRAVDGDYFVDIYTTRLTIL